MNFIQAIESANYNIVRRQGWQAERGGIQIKPKLGIPKLFWAGPNVATGVECKLLGPDEGIDLQQEDLIATDWEVCS